MSLEDAINKLTAAIEENTKAALSGVPAPSAPAKPAAKKVAKKKTAKVKEPEPDPEPEPEETPAEEVEVVEETEGFPTDRTEAITKITEFVKERIIDPNTDSDKIKANFSTLRESYEVSKVGELDDDKLEEFYNATVETLS